MEPGPPDSPVKPTPKKRRTARVASWTLGGAAILVGGVYGVGYAVSGETLPPNSAIEGVAVGGQTRAEAQATLRDSLAEKVAAPLTITAGDQSLTRTPEELGLSVDYAASVEALGGGKSANPVDIWQNLTGGSEVDAVVVADDAAVDAWSAELAQLADAEPVNAELVFEDGTPVVNDAVPGLTVDQAQTSAAVVAAFPSTVEIAAVTTQPEADITTEEAQTALTDVATVAVSGPITVQAGGKSFEVTPAMIAASLTFEPAEGVLVPVLDPETLMEKAEPAMSGLGLKEPKNASFTFSGGKPTVVASQNGVGVPEDEFAQAISQAMIQPTDRSASVTIGPLEAEFTTEEANALGVKEVTGEFTTSFPATAYRVNNIGKSAGLINGVLVKPGETFSMNQTLGPRTLARGWMAGGAIDGGQVVERMGGGISQTTTTLFNAIFFAGLEDVYHKPHSLYFSRYPMGREATLDYYSVDMKFRNNSDYGVVIQAFTNNPPVGGQGTITVRIWSTKVYDVRATDPVKSNIKNPGPTIYSNAAVCSPQSGMQGFTASLYREFRQNGKLVRREPFTWTYNTLTPVVCTNPNAKADRVER